MTDDSNIGVTMSIIFFFLVIIALLFAGAYKANLLKQDRDWRLSVDDNILLNSNNDNDIVNALGVVNSKSDEALSLSNEANNKVDSLVIPVIPEYDRLGVCTLVLNNETTFDAKCKRVQQ